VLTVQSLIHKDIQPLRLVVRYVINKGSQSSRCNCTNQAQQSANSFRCFPPYAPKKSGPITCPAILSIMVTGLPKGEFVGSRRCTEGTGYPA